MTFRISPDPRHPLGGHALLCADDGLSTGNGRLTIRRSYDGCYLGASGWQLARVSLGRLEADSYGLRLGPDVVRHINEFDNIEISFEDGSTDNVVWPDDVLHPPATARDGGLVGTRAKPLAGIAAKPLAGTPARPLQDALVAATDTVEAENNEEPAPRDTDSRRGVYLVVALVGVVLTIGTVLYLVRDDLVPVSDELVNLIPDETRLECGEGAVSDVADAGLLLDWVRRCATDERVTAQARLETVERLIGETPEALIIMGTWYDPGVDSDASPFDRPAIDVAARYYAEAAEAGAEGAQDLLDDVCGRLDADNFMQNEAIALYCGGGP